MMVNKMETTIGVAVKIGIIYRGHIGVILFLYGDNGKENGNYYIVYI